MKIGNTRPVGGVGKISGTAAKRYRDAEGATTSAPRDIQDTASVMGIPEAELTPKVRDAIMTLMEEVSALRKELAQAQSRLADVERLADQDSLLPVANRRAFVRELSRIASFSQRYKMPASLVYFDINNFKQVNDTFGHAAGDAVLAMVARELGANVRESDVVGRLGGDEFGVILAQADHATARQKAESLADIIRQTPVPWENEDLFVKIAFGVQGFDEAVEVKEAMALADKAMYDHKRRNRDSDD